MQNNNASSIDYIDLNIIIRKLIKLIKIIKIRKRVNKFFFLNLLQYR